MWADQLSIARCCTYMAELELAEATVVMGSGLHLLQRDLLLEAVGMELVQNEEASTKLHWLLH